MGADLEASHGAIVVYRYSWIAGIAAVVFAMWRLGELLRPTSGGAKWQFVVLAAYGIGLVVTWAALSYRMRVRWVLAINVALFVLAGMRYVAPNTGWWILPGPDTFEVAGVELERALDFIRHGIEPVLPIPGLILIVAGLFWTLGIFLALGLSKERPFLALIPPLVVGLQLLTIDRAPSSLVDTGIFVALVAGSALAVGLDEHERGAGRMARPGHHPSTGRSAPLSASAFALVALTVVGAVGFSNVLAGQVPADGFVEWRAPGGILSGLYGGVSYNPYVSIHAGLVSQRDIPLFSAAVDGGVHPNDLYFRMVTLDQYEDGRWFASDSDSVPATEGSDSEAGADYAGTTVPLYAAIRVHALTNDWVPAPYAVVSVSGLDAGNLELRTRDRSVLFAGGRTFDGMNYSVNANVPVIDSRAIVADADGNLSPLFAAAAAQGEQVPDPEPAPELTLDDAGLYSELPSGIDPRIRIQATDLTTGLHTNFEKGVILEKWFRETGGFVYDLDVDSTSGHAPDVLAAWLFDNEAGTNYRRGYCEQFATAMGVMARSIGIPTRVVLGFTPGRTVGDGEVLVTDLNGHSWVELWIPSHGWMRFDPTPRSDRVNPNPTYQRLEQELGFDVTEYLGLVPEPTVDPTDPAASPGVAPRPDFERVPIPRPTGGTEGGEGPPWFLLVPIALMIGLLAGIPAYKWWRRRSRMRRLAAGDVAAAWEEIVARLADLDRPIDPATTPREAAALVGTAMAPLAEVYGKSLYGPEELLTGGDIEDASRSMVATAQRLSDDLTPQQRVRAVYRLASVVDTSRRRVSPRLPWLRR